MPHRADLQSAMDVPITMVDTGGNFPADVVREMSPHARRLLRERFVALGNTSRNFKKEKEAEMEREKAERDMAEAERMKAESEKILAEAAAVGGAGDREKAEADAAVAEYLEGQAKKALKRAVKPRKPRAPKVLTEEQIEERKFKELMKELGFTSKDMSPFVKFKDYPF